jgi:class 3 adenylate cyclase/pimeloyl-ACP methyl ester carboxylesterase
MQPQIRYAKTSDGVNIAWYAVGQGLPFVWPTHAMGDLEQSWRTPEVREMLERIASLSTLISYNIRGFGLSDHGTTDFSCDAMVRDLEAVVEAAGLRRFTLQVFADMSIPALYYASRNPDRLFALVLLNGVLRGEDMSPGWQSLRRLAATDWELAVRLMVQSNEPGWQLTQTIRETREAFGTSTSRDAFLAYLSALAGWDGSEVAARVTTPTLVVHYTDSVAVPHEAARSLAAALPNGSFSSIKPADDERNIDVATRVITGFLRGVLPRPERPESPPAVSEAEREGASGTAVILFADIADSTALTERLGDAAFRAKARDLDAALRTIIRDHTGTPIEGKLLGDGVLATFTSARQAIEAALVCARSGDEAGLPLHLGLHAGDVIREENNVFGGAVNIASRIAGLSAAGEVLVSETVRSLARTSAGVAFEDRGEQTLKGVGEPVRVWAVRPSADQPLS